MHELNNNTSFRIKFLKLRLLKLNNNFRNNNNNNNMSSNSRTTRRSAGGGNANNSIAANYRAAAQAAAQLATAQAAAATGDGTNGGGGTTGGGGGTNEGTNPVVDGTAGGGGGHANGTDNQGVGDITDGMHGIVVREEGTQDDSSVNIVGSRRVYIHPSWEIMLQNLGINKDTITELALQGYPDINAFKVDSTE